MFKFIHTADLHFKNEEACLEEIIKVSDYMLRVIEKELPDAIILAGDTLDELHGRIRLDSEAARAAIDFVQQCATIAPVVIIKGTNSHDRQTPYIFRHLTV